MTTSTVHGWDLGGAHLKCVTMDGNGRLTDAVQIACTLWRGVNYLTEALETVRARIADPGALHAVTMTGELCDNFTSREAGVTAITAATVGVLDGSRVKIFAGPAGWVDPGESDPAAHRQCASANWYAMASAVAARVGDAVLVDVGSTTTDIVPLQNGRVACRGFDDATRLGCDELVYTGVVRTPLMALADSAPFEGSMQGLAAEYFANTADVYRLRGELPANADLHDTADGADRSGQSSARRVLRMFGRDADDTQGNARCAADYFAYRQFDLLQRALLRVTSGMSVRCETLVAAGAGAFLVERLAAFNGMKCIRFSSLFELAGADPELVSTCAPAAAVAALRHAAL